MTHEELKHLFQRSGAKQAEFVQWANEHGLKARPGDVSNHKSGKQKYPIGKRYADAYREFFAEKAKDNFRAALELATKNVLASGGKRVILDAPPEVADLIQQAVNAFGSPDFNPDQVIEALSKAADGLKSEGQPFGSLWAVANAIGGIADNAKKIY